MGKAECCTYCLEFYRARHGRQWGSNSRVVEGPGCSKCQERHEEEVKNQHLQYAKETDPAKLKDKSRLPLLNQKAQYEQLNAKLTLDLNNLRADYDRNLSEMEVLITKLTLELRILKAEKSLQTEFLKIRRDCNQGDIIIGVSDSRILAHRTILAARSPVFQKLMQGESSETHKKERPVIRLDCFISSGAVLEAIVDFCYSGEITFLEGVAPDEVLKAAHTFQLGFLSKLTESELCRRLTVENVPQMLKLARDYSAYELQQESGKLFKENFEILSSKVFEVMEGPHCSNSFKTSDLQLVLLQLYRLFQTAVQNWTRRCMDLVYNRT